MIKFNIYIKEYDWMARVFLAVHDYYVDDIDEALAVAGCSKKDRDKAIKIIMGDKLNTGLCFSNTGDRMSVLVISKTSSAGEFFNTITHEMTHLAIHIAETDGIDYRGEELCYLVGYIADQMFPWCRKLLCDCNRKRKIGIPYS